MSTITPVSPAVESARRRDSPATVHAREASKVRDDVPPISEAISRFTSSFSYEDLPPAMQTFAKYHALDVVGAALAATHMAVFRTALAGLGPLLDGGTSSVIGTSTKVPLRDAVLLNGILTHGLEYDDTHTAAQVHPTASTFPCAFGMAEFLDKSGQELLASYLLGAEITVRLGLAANDTLHRQGFHPTGIFAHFGCAIIAARLYGLDVEQTTSAQGLAGCTGAGLGEYRNDGSLNKAVHGGWPGVGGITVASLARGGYIGARRIYEGNDGLFRSHAASRFGDTRLDLITEGLGSVWHMQDAAIKPMPACHLLHASVEAGLSMMREQGLSADDIAEAVVLLHPQVFHMLCEPVEMRRRPPSAQSAQTSAQYVIGAALARGRLTFAELSAEAMRDERIQAMADRVTYDAYPESLHPKYLSGGITIRTRDGRTLTRKQLVNPGSGDRALSSDQIIRKFMENAEMGHVERDQADRICNSILDADRLTAREIAVAASVSR